MCITEFIPFHELIGQQSSSSDVFPLLIHKTMMSLSRRHVGKHDWPTCFHLPQHLSGSPPYPPSRRRVRTPWASRARMTGCSCCVRHFGATLAPPIVANGKHDGTAHVTSQAVPPPSPRCLAPSPPTFTSSCAPVLL